MNTYTTLPKMLQRFNMCSYLGLITPWTMKSALGRWPFSMVQLPWFDFLKNQFTKPLGPSSCANRKWTNRNDHAPKNECVKF